MRKALTVALDDETIRKVNEIAFLRYGKDKKVSSLIKEIVDNLYDDAMLLSRKDNDVAGGFIVYSSNEGEKRIIDFNSVKFPCKRVEINIDFNGKMFIDSLVFSYKNLETIL